jgi:hypothetical protein
MSSKLASLKVLIIEIGLFIIFLVGFGKFVYTEIANFLR